jgi:hypothetical protein
MLVFALISINGRIFLSWYFECLLNQKTQPRYRIKISNRRATQQCNMSSFFYAKICSLLARRQSSQPVQCVYWPENVIDWLGKWRPTCVMRHAQGQKLQSFRRKWPFYMDLYSITETTCKKMQKLIQWDWNLRPWVTLQRTKPWICILILFGDANDMHLPVT